MLTLALSWLKAWLVRYPENTKYRNGIDGNSHFRIEDTFKIDFETR